MASYGIDPACRSGKHARAQENDGSLSDAVIALPGGCGTLEGVARNHHLETIGTLSESGGNTECQRVF